MGRPCARKIAVGLALVALCVPAGAQSVQAEIEADVWIPLFRASNAFDADGFLAVQSADLVRVSLDAQEVYGLARYAREIREGFARARQRGIVRTSDARFLERSASGDLAYETGYFRSRVTVPGGEPRVSYTRFEFVLRKERGKWRVLVDKDTSLGGTITAADFEAAAPMQHAGSGGGALR